MASKVPKSINLLDPVNAPGDLWAGLYDWVFSVGKYLLVAVQVVVLAVFFSRFIFDKKNNDLTDDINDQVDALTDPFFRSREIKYLNIHDLLEDIAILEEYQITNAEEIGGLLSSIPQELRLEQFAFNDGGVNMSFSSDNEDAIKLYERQLDENPLYGNVSVSFSQSGNTNDVSFAVIFSILPDEENLIEALKD
jgi:hypothetical protein